MVWRAMTWRSFGPRLAAASTPIPASRSWGDARLRFISGPRAPQLLADAPRAAHRRAANRQRTPCHQPAPADTQRQQTARSEESLRRRCCHARALLFSHGRGHGLHLVLARKTVSAADRCNRTMTCRSALDTDAACGRQPLLYSAPSLLESSWWPAVPRIRLLPRRQGQPSRLPRARRRPRSAPVGPSLASSR